MRISTELVDAFPADCLTRWDGFVRELRVAIDNDDGGLCTRVCRVSPKLMDLPETRRVKTGTLKPASPAARQFMHSLGRVLRRGSRALTYDYGASDFIVTHADNFRTFGPHLNRSKETHGDFADALVLAGLVDITYDTNFTSLKIAGEQANLRTLNYSTQTAFLMRNGLVAAARTARKRSPDLEMKKILAPALRFGLTFRALLQQKVA